MKGTKTLIDSYVALDIETTGLNPAADRIIEIGMARVCNGNVTDTYSTLVNPGIKISDRIIELTHIHNEELTDKPRINELIEDVIHFIGDYPILGHNVIFDYSFLKKAAVNNNLVFPSAGIDTLKMARRILPELEHKKLDYLCEYLKIDPGNSHRALAAADPLHVIPACLIGSGIAGAISMLFKCTLMAPHGGIFVFPVVGNPLYYLLALVVGTIVSCFLLGVLKKKVNE